MNFRSEYSEYPEKKTYTTTLIKLNEIFLSSRDSQNLFYACMWKIELTETKDGNLSDIILSYVHGTMTHGSQTMTTKRRRKMYNQLENANSANVVCVRKIKIPLLHLLLLLLLLFQQHLLSTNLLFNSIKQFLHKSGYFYSIHYSIIVAVSGL